MSIPMTSVIFSVFDRARSILPTADRRNLPPDEFSSCISSEMEICIVCISKF